MSVVGAKSTHASTSGPPQSGQRASRIGTSTGGAVSCSGKDSTWEQKKPEPGFRPGRFGCATLVYIGPSETSKRYFLDGAYTCPLIPHPLYLAPEKF